MSIFKQPSSLHIDQTTFSERMEDWNDEHITLINRLLADKDQWLTEKARMMVEKDDLWRGLYQTLRERDGEIEALKNGRTQPVKKEPNQDLAEITALREEVNSLKARNNALESTLKQMLDKDEDEEDVEMDGVDDMDEVAVNEEVSVKREPCDSPVSLPRVSPYVDTISSVMSGSIVGISPPSKSGLRPGHPAKFTFAPLIEVSNDGAYDFGKIGEVAASVLESIQRQIKTLGQRQQDGKAPSAPTPNLPAKGCMWRWMHGHSGETRWTLDAPGTYTCAGCFNARRACLLNLGDMKWMILPLPPAVRSDEEWDRAGFYIFQKPKGTDRLFPGVWEQTEAMKSKAQ